MSTFRPHGVGGPYKLHQFKRNIFKQNDEYIKRVGKVAEWKKIKLAQHTTTTPRHNYVYSFGHFWGLMVI